jgi:hypothetical protein
MEREPAEGYGMTKKEFSEALKPLISVTALTDFLLGLPEAELTALPLSPLRKHALTIGADLDSGELAELLKAAVENDKRRPCFERIGGADITPILWRVKKFLEADAVGMIYGDSGTYKSFLSVALAACIGTGKNFYGMPVKKGAVYYIAAEGAGGLKRRFRAWGQENAPTNEAPLYRYKGAVNLLEAADVLRNCLEEAVSEEPEPPALAMVDTWSQALGGGDDSDTEASSKGLARLREIKALFPGLSILIIHHTGHANKDRARGWSGLHAAMDCEYRLELDKDKNIILTNTKAKESELLPPIAFRPRSVKLIDDNGGYILNEDGEIETSIVLDRVEYKAPSGETGLGKNQERILEILRSTEEGNMEVAELLETFKKRYGGRKDSFDKAVIALEERDLIYRELGFVCSAKFRREKQ